MYLAGIRIVHLGPFENVHFPFRDDEGQPRLATVVHGGGGVGKTALLHAIAATRPGHAVAAAAPQRDSIGEVYPVREETPPAQVICDWILGQDEPSRTHVLRVAGPNVRVFQDDQREAMRRREQIVFDKLAREGGFALLVIPSSRWFSRQPIVITSPARTIARHEVRAVAGIDELGRSDLSRETKQALAYAGIAASLARGSRGAKNFEVLDDAMRFAVDTLLALCQLSYRGIDPGSFEPVFQAAGVRALTFDALPTRARHLIAFAALSVRTLWAAYPGRDPREVEGLVLIDEVCLQQDPAVQAGLVAALRLALPRVQWVLTTPSPVIAGACDTREVLALRRLPDTFRVELYTGSEARTH